MKKNNKDNIIIEMRLDGYTFEQIGKAVGKTRQAVQQKYESLRISKFTRRIDLIDAKVIVKNRLDKVIKQEIDVAEGYVEALKDVLKLFDSHIEKIKRVQNLPSPEINKNDPLSILIK